MTYSVVAKQKVKKKTYNSKNKKLLFELMNQENKEVKKDGNN
jgi:hypothetical protein